MLDLHILVIIYTDIPTKNYRYYYYYHMKFKQWILVLSQTIVRYNIFICDKLDCENKYKHFMLNYFSKTY